MISILKPFLGDSRHSLLRWISISFLGLSFACGQIRYVPVQGETIVKDSLIIETRIDTLKVQLPPEMVRDWTGLLDTLEMNTSTAVSRSWVDTTFGILTGELANKETPVDVAVPSTHTLEKKDSIIYKEVPIPAQVEKKVTPKLYPWSLGLNLFLILTIGIGTYFKFFYRK